MTTGTALDTSEPTAVLTARGLTVRYGSLVALESVDLTFRRGELVAVVGRNGAGKSSLLRALAGVTGHAGSVFRGAGHGPDPRVAYVAQRATARWDLPLSVRQVVSTGRLRPHRWWRRGTATDRRAVDDALDRFDLGELCDRPVATLSGGQAQRVLLARALAQRPDVLLLDEPFAGLDSTNVGSLLSALAELSARDICVACALHELDLARTAFRRAVALDRAVLADGPAADVLSAEGLEVLFGLRTAR